MNMMNIMQIDVEDWYHSNYVLNWELCEDRVFESTKRILAILKSHNSRATFFILGRVAEKFETDLLKSIDILEKITGDKILGYRAPYFTIVEKTSWAIDIMKNNGLKYDSSVFPVKTRRYGVPDAPLFPYHISSANIKRDTPSKDFMEIPLSVYPLPVIGKNLPIAGGFYVRFFPFFFIRKCLSHINKQNHPAVCFLHPWEIDPEQPRIRELTWYHYYRLSSTETKFDKLLENFSFTSTKEYLKL
jgi:polysaccharide deacetylase family protein (PEP-CTERM system associated)